MELGINGKLMELKDFRFGLTSCPYPLTLSLLFKLENILDCSVHPSGLNPLAECLLCICSMHAGCWELLSVVF